jgi:hypothetical protein
MTTTSSTSFWTALILSLGALIFYVGNAFFLRSKNREKQDRLFDFNLGLPTARNNESLFAITLVAAGTSLSTVFVFFLTAGTIYGAWIRGSTGRLRRRTHCGPSRAFRD